MNQARTGITTTADALPGMPARIELDVPGMADTEAVVMMEPAELYERYATDVFRFALYLSGERAEAEDLTSETFVRAWTAPESIRVATVKAYLFTITRNLYITSRRRRRREVELDEATAAGLRDRAAGAESRVEHGRELAAVLAALQALPEMDRAALIMRATDEMPYEEIARTLGISVPAARVKVHRARLALMEARHDRLA